MALTKASRGVISTGVSDSSDATAITIDSSENVGIGGVPSHKLHVHGDIYSPANVTAYSSAAAKADIETIANPLDLVAALRGVSFTWKETGQKSQGLIYEEVSEVIPEGTSAHGGDVGIQYANLVGVLIEAVKELRSEIKELKEKR